MEYVTSAHFEGCFLCIDAVTDHFEDNHVLMRDDLCMVVMNRFPYNSGAVLIAPLRHVGALEDLTVQERTRVMDLTVTAIEALKATMNPDGFNIGANLGAAGGAGVPGHMHMHVIPRWSGDTNFMPVVGDTKVLPETLEQSYSRLKLYFYGSPID
ncbi:HIT domain-containing protein [soil metagenome]